MPRFVVFSTGTNNDHDDKLLIDFVIADDEYDAEAIIARVRENHARLLSIFTVEAFRYLADSLETDTDTEINEQLAILTELYGDDDPQTTGDDVCDTCMRSGVTVYETDNQGRTRCVECAEGGDA